MGVDMWFMEILEGRFLKETDNLVTAGTDIFNQIPTNSS